jgi:hypothetical protein
MHLIQDVQKLIILSKGGLEIQHPHKRADGLGHGNSFQVLNRTALTNNKDFKTRTRPDPNCEC